MPRFPLLPVLLGLACKRPPTPPVPASAGSARAMPAASLIPREVLFGNPERASVKLSPDGSRLSFVAPLDGVMNVWVAPAEDPAAARALTHDTGRGITMYDWAWKGDRIQYIQDRDGDENWHIFQVSLDGGEPRDLTPIAGVQARFVGASPHVPDAVLIGLNDRDPRFHDVWRLDLATGERSLVYQNDEYAAFVADANLELRVAAKSTDDGGFAYMKGHRKGEKLLFEPFFTVGPTDSMTTEPFAFDREGDTLFGVDSRGRDTAAAVTFDLASGASTVVAESPRADLADVLVHPTTLEVQAAAFNYDRVHWEILDDSIRADMDRLAAVDKGDVEVLSRALDDRRWLVGYRRDDGPYRFYRYDRDAGTATFLFSNRPGLESHALAPMRPVVVKSRDGLDLVSYLTLPLASDPDGDGRPSAPVPMVLWVHGGPWARDSWGLVPVHQWLANRGYAVLSVNYRGSTGFGKAFVNAADRQWGGRMHDDLVDAVDWAAGSGVTTREAVAIGGGSYGGFATLTGMTRTPDRFACGVDIVGPSNLVTFMETIPPYWAPLKGLLVQRIGDPATPEGRAFLLERSPLTHVDAIRRPLIIGQGANDPRVKRAESDQIVAAMQAKGLPVTYLLYPDEGHGFARPENRTSFFAASEVFLADCLGGAKEEMGTIEGTSMQVIAGGAG